MGLHDPVQLTRSAHLPEQKLFKRFNRGHRHGIMVVNKLLSTWDMRQVQYGFRGGIQASDMRNHHAGSILPAGRQAQRFDQIVGIPAGRTHQMRRVIVHVVEVQLSAEGLVIGTCKEIHASVAAQNGVASSATAATGAKHE